MHFDKAKNPEYGRDTLYSVIFEVRFPEIIKIQTVRPALFQEKIMEEGYTDFIQGSIAAPVGPIENLLPDEVRMFHFLTEQRDWDCFFNRSSFALQCFVSCNYMDFRHRLESALRIFCNIYTIPYFNRVALVYQNMVNSVFIPKLEVDVSSLIPDYVFPVLTTRMADDVSELRNISIFSDSEIKSRVTHSLLYPSGIFGQKEVSNEKSYTVEVECYQEKNMGVDINDILIICDGFKEVEWNIFEWSITDALRKYIQE